MPKIVNHEEYRQEILWKSFEIFARKGYAALSVRELAKELGISTGTLYHYFPSKQALFESLISHLNRLEEADFAPLARQAHNLEEKVEALFTFIARNEQSWRLWTAILIDLERHNLREIIESKSWREANLFYANFLKNFLGTEDEALVNFIMAYICGFIVHRIERGEELNYQEQSQVFYRLLRPQIKDQSP